MEACSFTPMLDWPGRGIGFGCLGVGVMGFWGLGMCCALYAKSQLESSGTLISATHILGETGK